MKVGKVLYVRKDIKVEGKKTTAEAFQAHIDYLTEVSKKRMFMGGGFLNEAGGMIVYEASSLEDAKAVADRDPIIANGFYEYELNEWELVLVSDNIKQ